MKNAITTNYRAFTPAREAKRIKYEAEFWQKGKEGLAPINKNRNQ